MKLIRYSEKMRWKSWKRLISKRKLASLFQKHKKYIFLFIFLISVVLAMSVVFAWQGFKENRVIATLNESSSDYIESSIESSLVQSNDQTPPIPSASLESSLVQSSASSSSSISTSSSVSVQSQKPVSSRTSSQVSQKSSRNPNTGHNFYVDYSGKIHTYPQLKGVPIATWLNTGDAVQKAQKTLEKAGSSTPVFVLYYITNRDCGSYSAGGAASAGEYLSWVQSIANTISSKAAWIILEPDALAGLDCLDEAKKSERYSLLGSAVKTLKSKQNITVFIDAGHAKWHSTAVMKERLQKVEIASADGFALNVSNFVSTSQSIQYGLSLSASVGEKKFVIDTSRNGNGEADGGQWCNPSGRAFGEFPTRNTGNAKVSAFLWVKYPGESDGACNGGPQAGVWWPEYIEKMIQNSFF